MNTAFRRQLTIGLCIIFGSFVLFGGFVYYLTQKLQTQSTDITNQRSQLELDANSTEALSLLKSQAPQASTSAQFLNNLLPSSDELLNFPDWIRGVAVTNNLTFNFQFEGDSVAPQPPTPGYINFAFSASGAPTDINAFLNNIEIQLPQFLINIQNFTLSNNNDGTEGLSVQGQVFFN